MRQAYFLELLSGLFDFLPMEQALKRYVRLLDEHLYKLFPKQLAAYKEEVQRLHEKVIKVSQKFSLQYTRLIDEAQNYATDSRLQERIHSAADYFKEQLQPLEAVMENGISSDNKELKKKLRDAMEELGGILALKVGLFRFVLANGFHVAEYLKQKALLSIDGSSLQKGKSKPASGKEGKKVGLDVFHPELYDRLVAWRNAEAAHLGRPVYTVIQQKAIMGISNLLPSDKAMLMRIPYLGKKGIEKYGDVILGMVRAYLQEVNIVQT